MLLLPQERDCPHTWPGHLSLPASLKPGSVPSPKSYSLVAPLPLPHPVTRGSLMVDTAVLCPLISAPSVQAQSRPDARGSLWPGDLPCPSIPCLLPVQCWMPFFHSTSIYSPGGAGGRGGGPSFRKTPVPAGPAPHSSAANFGGRMASGTVTLGRGARAGEGTAAHAKRRAVGHELFRDNRRLPQEWAESDLWGDPQQATLSGEATVEAFCRCLPLGWHRARVRRGGRGAGQAGQSGLGRICFSGSCECKEGTATPRSWAWAGARNTGSWRPGDTGLLIAPQTHLAPEARSQ